MKTLLTIALLTLTGCSVTNVITPANSTGATFQSTASPERTYRNVLDAVRKCYPRLTVETGYFPEAREGSINLSIRHDSSVRIELIDVQVAPPPRGLGAAIVTLRAAKGYEDFLAALPHWVEAVSDPCPYGAVLS